MLDAAWLALRQAQEALKNGRLEEAERILQLPAARDHRRTGALLTRLARGYVERGERYLKLDDAEGAWRDLLQAERLGTGEKSCDRLRQTLTGLGMAELRALLETGEINRAEAGATLLRGRGARSPELQVLEGAIRNWLLASDLASRGEFTPALEALGRARRVLTTNRALGDLHTRLTQQRDSFPEVLGRLLGAANGGHWREVIELAEQALALVPQHGEARNLRARAWKAIEPGTVTVGQGTRAPEGNGELEKPTPRPANEFSPRFLLWIDGVGGFLICLGGRLTFGQATPDARVDVPLVADVSRMHASLARDGEGYLLEALRPVQINGQPTTRMPLQSGDRVTLGASCQFQFRLPVPGSTTARLDVVSGHRLPVGVDGVLLLAQTLVLGNGTQAHITVPDMKQPVVLFRHKDGLGLRHAGELRINGETTTGRTLLPAHASVTGDDFGFALEPA